MLKVNSSSSIYPSNPSSSLKKRNDGETHTSVTEKKLEKEIQKEPNKVVTPDNVKSALESFNKVFKPTHLDFQFHEDAGKYFVQVIDDTSKEVIVQIPSEEFLQMVSEAKEQLGLLFDKRV